jgi:hypothetical protein
MCSHIRLTILSKCTAFTRVNGMKIEDSTFRIMRQAVDAAHFMWPTTVHTICLEG